ncbi:MAG TPA: hypothetical protein PLX17_01370 [Chitinophagaceae bacterium]|nr:hypothetical protein [Chitinophagaceae bacterium]
MANFIPSFHFLNPLDKVSGKDFALSVINYYWHNTATFSLLEGKNVREIEQYAAGEFDLLPFKKIFKSEQKRLLQNSNANTLENKRTAIGIDYYCYPLIPEKLNSAISIIQKIPIEISCVAVDPLAIEKKQSDVNFLKNKAAVELELQDVQDRLNLGKVDLGTTENASVEFSDSPFGLDLTNNDELDIFINLIYSLKIETAFETILEYFKELKKINQLKLMEIKDHMKYGVSCHSAYENDLTGLPDAEYEYPGSVLTPYSELPDYSDNTHRIIPKAVTPMQLFDYFGSEIGSEKELEELINNAQWGYCFCNKIEKQPRNNWDTWKMNLLYVEVKTIDWIGISKRKNSRFSTFTTDPDKATEKIWAQNTYGFWWLQNTEKVFGMHKLPYSQRTKGKESYQNFSTNIYKSQEKSAVELSIGENKKAQIADIKLQHAVIMSKPGGGYFDLRYMRSALESLKDDANDWTMERLLTLAWEQNIMLGDTEGFDGKNDGQFKPFIDIPGGLKSEIIGYMNIIAAANINISRITGVNQQLTGQSANEEGLIGLQKLLINASINALHYCNEGVEFQMQALFSTWASIVQDAIRKGGKPKKAIENVIGAKKVSVIDGLKDAPLHEIGVFVKIKQREEERQLFKNKLTQLEQAGVLSASDSFMVNNIANPKDQWAFIAVKEQQFKKRADEIRQQQFEQSQELIKQQGENQVASKAAEAEGNIKNTYAKGTVQAQITQLAGQLGMSEIQMEGLIKNQLQKDRNKAQTDKNIETLTVKNNLQQQNALQAQ